MSDILCDISAFRYHRTPPQVIALCPPIPPFESDARRRAFKTHPLVKEVIGAPAHALVADAGKRAHTASIKTHLAAGELPFGAIADTPLGVSVSSPAFTLFQMGRRIPEAHLIMAMYEFCGWFTVFKPSPTIESLLNEHASELEAISPRWKRVRDANGQPTDLWQRPPLVEIDELQRFANVMREARGGRIFWQAAQCVTGVTASPFEVQASMLLGLPRQKGGEGFPQLQNNQRIKLSKAARTISGQANCYADITLEGKRGARPLVIECQGQSIHNSQRAAISDSDRTTALHQMGYEVLLLSYGQIAKQSNFDVIRKLIAKKLETAYQAKGSLLVAKEATLRRDLFIDWNMLGSWQKAPRGGHAADARHQPPKTRPK